MTVAYVSRMKNEVSRYKFIEVSLRDRQYLNRLVKAGPIKMVSRWPNWYRNRLPYGKKGIQVRFLSEGTISFW